MTSRAFAILAALLLAATASAEPVELKLWRHETRADELEQSFAAIRRFNDSQVRWRVVVETLPAGSYTSAITASALAGQLPCIIDLDQPVVPNFAWSGHMRPLDDLISANTLAALSEGGKGRYKGRVYSVGQFDVVLVIFAQRSVLERYGIRIATMELPYTAEEFRDILRRVKLESPELFPLDLNSRNADEWIPYGYSPWVQSAGGDLIDRSTYLQADGVINGPASIDVAYWYKSLFDEGLAEQKTVDEQALIQGRSVFHYTGSWEINRYTEYFGDDLVLMPPPDFGNGPKSGAGSWHWGITSSCEYPAGAAEFIEFLMRPEEIADLSNVRSLIPTTEAGAEMSQYFSPDAPYRKLYEYARAYAVKRPETPGYPKISAAFEKAYLDIRYGRNVEDALDTAADAIEYDIKRNRGYGFGSR
jgi:multiple sugar transport system substrate-binding protein